jgi:outer membrane protein
MSKRLLAMALCMSLGGALGSARAEDLLQIYRDALTSDPTLASARASWMATQENVPQARAGLLPSVLLSALANEQDYKQTLHTDPQTNFSQRFPSAGYTVSASQPLYRAQNQIGYDQAKQQVSQSDYVLASVQQDLIVRVAQAYFNVLLAQFTIELTESQKAAVSENLAQAKRNFEVGTATITDTNDAQAKYDQIVAQEISVRNDLENALAALRAIIGRLPKDLKRFDRKFQPEPPSPNALEPWIDKAVRENLQVRIAQANLDIATLEVDRQRAGHYPTLDLVASFNQNYAGGGASTALASNFGTDYRLGLIGVQLNLPIYQGGVVDSRVRQAIANQDATRQNLEAARRSAQLLAQNSFAGVTNGVAQLKALEQALTSAQVSYDSNKLGLEVGVRTNLDVLNQQQQVFQTRFNLAQAYYNYVINALKLKQAVGTLNDTDVEQINRDLNG